MLRALGEGGETKRNNMMEWLHTFIGKVERIPPPPHIYTAESWISMTFFLYTLLRC